LGLGFDFGVGVRVRVRVRARVRARARVRVRGEGYRVDPVAPLDQPEEGRTEAHPQHDARRRAHDGPAKLARDRGHRRASRGECLPVLLALRRAATLPLIEAREHHSDGVAEHLFSGQGSRVGAGGRGRFGGRVEVKDGV